MKHLLSTAINWLIAVAYLIRLICHLLIFFIYLHAFSKLLIQKHKHAISRLVLMLKLFRLATF